MMPPPNLRSVVSRGGRDVAFRRNFGSYYESKRGRRRRVTSEIKEKLSCFGRYTTYGYCTVLGWAFIQMLEHRRRIEIDVAERHGIKPKTSFRHVLRWLGF